MCGCAQKAVKTFRALLERQIYSDILLLQCWADDIGKTIILEIRVLHDCCTLYSLDKKQVRLFNKFHAQINSHFMKNHE